MSISQVRTFFRNRVEAVDAAFKEFEDRFDPELIPRKSQAKAYHIELGNISSAALDDLNIEDDLTVNVRLMFKDKKNYSDNIDASYDIAHNVRKECVNHARTVGQANIKQVVCNSITKEEIDGSDRTLIYNLEFSVRLIFAP